MISDERLEELADKNTICKVSWDERVAMAKELLALRKAREGWKLVPVEPTIKMINGFWGEITHGQEEVAAAKEAYVLMLAAAPEPQ